ncbi:MAG: hypothetical protein JWL86_3801 [Rhizobium sp.]|nr:hypothetical protein [Rhizobium sp.]
MHIERVLREYGQLTRPMSEAPRDGTRILGHAARSGRIVSCSWETSPSVLTGPVWTEEPGSAHGYLDRYFDGWLDVNHLRLLDTNAINRLLVAYIDDARAADNREALRLLEA